MQPMTLHPPESDGVLDASEDGRPAWVVLTVVALIVGFMLFLAYVLDAAEVEEGIADNIVTTIPGTVPPSIG